MWTVNKLAPGCRYSGACMQDFEQIYVSLYSDPSKHKDRFPRALRVSLYATPVNRIAFTALIQSVLITGVRPTRDCSARQRNKLHSYSAIISSHGEINLQTSDIKRRKYVEQYHKYRNKICFKESHLLLDYCERIRFAFHYCYTLLLSKAYVYRTMQAYCQNMGDRLTHDVNTTALWLHSGSIMSRWRGNAKLKSSAAVLHTGKKKS